MKTIRMVSACALLSGIAGCATTGPEMTKAPTAPSIATVAKAPPKPVAPQVSVAAALPSYVSVETDRRVAPVAPPYEPVAPVRYERVAPVASVPSVVQAVPKVQPRYEPVERAVEQPAPAPQRIAMAEPVYLPEETAPAPRMAVELPIPMPVSVSSYEPVEAQPTPLGRSMAPIYDDPLDVAASDPVRQHARKGYRPGAARRAAAPRAVIRSNFTESFGRQLESAALGRLNPSIRYDARYVKIGYPWGDVPASTGVCTDVVIRAYRNLGIDLQQLVHEDMRRAFAAYPSRRIYGLSEADPNIDHRRVVNLEAFFERTGASVPVGNAPEDFRAGDVLTWRLSGNEPHIGIVIDERDPRTGYPLVVHNLGAGVRKDDLISLDRPVGQFRFAPDRDSRMAMLANAPRGTNGG